MKRGCDDMSTHTPNPARKQGESAAGSRFGIHTDGLINSLIPRSVARTRPAGRATVARRDKHRWSDSSLAGSGGAQTCKPNLHGLRWLQ